MFDNIAMASGQIGTDPKHVAEANAPGGGDVRDAASNTAGRGTLNGAAGLPEWPSLRVLDALRATMMWET